MSNSAVAVKRVDLRWSGFPDGRATGLATPADGLFG